MKEVIVLVLALLVMGLLATLLAHTFGYPALG